jgi:competence protein ComEA
MKSVKNLFEETMGLLEKQKYTMRYVPHNIIEDYNPTYNVIYRNKHVTTAAAEELRIPLNEIWISEMWKPYEKYILFHELREIYHRAKGLSRDEAHEKSMHDGSLLWKNDPSLQKLVREIHKMDQKTAEKKKHNKRTG